VGERKEEACTKLLINFAALRFTATVPCPWPCPCPCSPPPPPPAVGLAPAIVLALALSSRSCLLCRGEAVMMSAAAGG